MNNIQEEQITYAYIIQQYPELFAKYVRAFITEDNTYYNQLINFDYTINNPINNLHVIITNGLKDIKKIEKRNWTAQQNKEFKQLLVLTKKIDNIKTTYQNYIIGSQTSNLLSQLKQKKNVSKDQANILIQTMIQQDKQNQSQVQSNIQTPKQSFSQTSKKSVRFAPSADQGIVNSNTLNRGEPSHATAIFKTDQFQYSSGNDSVQQTVNEMEVEASRLSQLSKGKELKDTFSQYDRDVSKYFDEIFKSMEGSNTSKNATSNRFNTMINDTIFNEYSAEKAELSKLKNFMSEHKWASIKNVSQVIDTVYKQKLQSIKNTTAKLGYSQSVQNSIVNSVKAIVQQSVSTQIMTFQYIYAQYILFKTAQSYINVADKVEESISQVLQSMMQPDIASANGLNQQQQKIINMAIQKYKSNLNQNKEKIQSVLTSDKFSKTANITSSKPQTMGSRMVKTV